MSGILLINICKEKLHYYEFVSPIEGILKKNKKKFFTKSYAELHSEDLEMCEKVIICGTSLSDNEFSNDFRKFDWLENFDKPVLGICGGMQIIGLVFGGQIKKQTEIGFYRENFENDFLGLSGEVEVYHLHNNYVDFNTFSDFEVFSESKDGVNKISQAVKHKNKEIYGVLFHPEVRQKELILNFLSFKN
jgi:anthranilate/para-aminobenzoate synthase component II